MSRVDLLILDAHDALNDCGLGRAADAILTIPDAPPALPLRFAWDALMARRWGIAECRASEALRAMEAALGPLAPDDIADDGPTEPIPDSETLIAERHRLQELADKIDRALEDLPCPTLNVSETWDPCGSPGWGPS